MSLTSSAGADLKLCSTTATAPRSACVHEVTDLDTDCEFESDIVDQCSGLIGGLEQQEIPQRPSSRLGFHSSSSNYYGADLEDPNETMLPGTINWTNRISYATAGDEPEGSSVDLASTAMAFDEDITTVATADDLQDELTSTRSIGIRITSTSQFDDVNPFLSSDDDSDCSDSESDCSSCENSDEDFEFSLSPLTLHPSKPSSVSMTSLATPVARLPAPSAQPIRPPTPTDHDLPSTFPLRIPSPTPIYHNHGYSRHALLHLKWFWTTREVKWAEHDAQIRDSNPFSGTAADSGHPSSGFGSLRSPTQRHLVQRFKPKSPPPQSSSTLPPMSVHPRRGDIVSLRDPYCMHIDRCFVNMPSWTLAKTMYMFDVHVGCEWHTRVAELNKWKKRRDICTAETDPPPTSPSADPVAGRKKEPSSDSFDDVDLDSESESLGTSASVASSDDSDATLVESDHEVDLEREDYSTFEAFITGAGPSSPTSSSSSSDNDNNTPRLKFSTTSPPSPTGKPSSSPSSSKCPFSPSLYAQMPSPSSLSSFDHDAEPPPKPWPTNWYHRWEILMELMRFNWDQHQLFAALSIKEHPYSADVQLSSSSSSSSPGGGANVSGRKGKRRLKRQPRFHFGDENSAEDSDSWEWDPSFDWKNCTAQISEPGFGLGVQAVDGSVLL